LQAADGALRATGKPDIAALAKHHGVDADAVTAWMDYLGIWYERSDQARTT